MRSFLFYLIQAITKLRLCTHSRHWNKFLSCTVQVWYSAERLWQEG